MCFGIFFKYCHYFLFFYIWIISNDLCGSILCFPNTFQRSLIRSIQVDCHTVQTTSILLCTEGPQVCFDQIACARAINWFKSTFDALDWLVISARGFVGDMFTHLNSLRYREEASIQVNVHCLSKANSLKWTECELAASSERLTSATFLTSYY